MTAPIASVTGDRRARWHFLATDLGKQFVNGDKPVFEFGVRSCRCRRDCFNAWPRRADALPLGGFVSLVLDACGDIDTA